jgi:peptidoglycan/LPS O-acetylase OafA/YrhL
MGVLLAYFIPAILPKLKAAASRVRAAFFVVGVLAYGTRLLTKLSSEKWQISALPEKIIWTITALGCVAILLAALSSRRLDMVLNHPSLTFLGRISYSVYLLHFLILLSVVPAFVHGLNLLHIQNGLIVIPATLTFMLVLTIAASALSYKWIEMPSINLGRWLCNPKGRQGPAISKTQAPVLELEEMPKK